MKRSRKNKAKWDAAATAGAEEARTQREAGTEGPKERRLDVGVGVIEGAGAHHKPVLARGGVAPIAHMLPLERGITGMHASSMAWN